MDGTEARVKLLGRSILPVASGACLLVLASCLSALILGRRTCSGSTGLVFIGWTRSGILSAAGTKLQGTIITVGSITHCSIGGCTAFTIRLPLIYAAELLRIFHLPPSPLSWIWGPSFFLVKMRCFGSCDPQIVSCCLKHPQLLTQYSKIRGMIVNWIDCPAKCRQIISSHLISSAPGCPVVLPLWHLPVNKRQHHSASFSSQLSFGQLPEYHFM